MLHLGGEARHPAVDLDVQREGVGEFAPRRLESSVAERRGHEAGRGLADRGRVVVDLLPHGVEAGEDPLARAPGGQLLRVQLQHRQAHPRGAEMHLRSVVQIPLQRPALQGDPVVAPDRLVAERIDLPREPSFVVPQQCMADPGPSVGERRGSPEHEREKDQSEQRRDDGGGERREYLIGVPSGHLPSREDHEGRREEHPEHDDEEDARVGLLTGAVLLLTLLATGLSTGLVVRAAAAAALPVRLVLPWAEMAVSGAGTFVVLALALAIPSVRALRAPLRSSLAAE